MIRHAGLDLTVSIPLLAIPMVEPAFGALLVTAVGAAPLAEPRKLLTGATTVALAAVATGTQKEDGPAFAVAANPSSEEIVRHRHTPWQAALDNGSSFVAG